MRHASFLVLGAAAVGVALACASCRPASPQAPPTILLDQPAPAAATTQGTRLSSNGCSVRMPGAWSAVKEEPDGGWGAQSADGHEALSVLRIDWHPKTSWSEWREDLGAVLGIRRDADRNQHGPRTTWTEPELFAHPTSPGAMYTLHDPDEPVRMATLARATQTRICVFFLSSDAADEGAFIAHARAVMAGTEAGP
jgi:hypothetical protein